MCTEIASMMNRIEGGAIHAVKLSVSPTNVTFLAYQELNKRLILHRTGNWEGRFVFPPDCQLLKNDGKQTQPTILGANKKCKIMSTC